MKTETLCLAIKVLDKERRKYRHLYDLYMCGMESERRGAQHYVQLDEAIAELKRQLEEPCKD
jgi:hypothetical protein